MTDRFQEYLSQNAGKLSPEMPRDEVWEQIRRRSIKRTGTLLPHFIKWSVACCIILLIGLAIYVFILQTNGGPEKASIVTSEKIKEDTVQNPHSVERKKMFEPVRKIKGRTVRKNSLARTSTKRKDDKKQIPASTPGKFIYIAGEELALKYENNFTKFIEKEKAIISTTPVYGITSDYFDLFTKDYQLLEADEERLKKNIKDTGGSVDALDEMIVNFQRRIELLKLLRAEIERKNDQNRGKEDLSINYVRII